MGNRNKESKHFKRQFIGKKKTQVTIKQMKNYLAHQ